MWRVLQCSRRSESFDFDVAGCVWRTEPILYVGDKSWKACTVHRSFQNESVSATLVAVADL